eukprot:scaffold1352_cov144-Cylindrotheca_fusiformis.AAC.5
MSYHVGESYVAGGDGPNGQGCVDVVQKWLRWVPDRGTGEGLGRRKYWPQRESINNPGAVARRLVAPQAGAEELLPRL